MKWARHSARMGEKKAHRISVGKSEGKISLEKLRRRRENIKLDVSETGCG
jgi:hypothetical protein